MERLNEKFRFSKIIYLISALFSVFILIYFSKFEGFNTIINYSNSVVTLSDGWLLQSEKRYVRLPYTVEASDIRNNKVIVSQTLAKNSKIENNAIAIRSYYCDVNMYLDNKKIYSYKSYKNGIGQSDGEVCLMADIPKNNKKSTLKIEYIPQFYMKSYNIKAPVYGEKADIIMNYYEKGKFDTLTAVVLIFGGISCIGFHLISPRKIRVELGFVHIGAFSFIAGIYLLSQIEWVHILMAHQKMLYISQCMSLCLEALPILLLVYKFIDYRLKVIFKTAAIVNVINFILQITVYFLGIKELRTMINYSYLILFTSSFLIGAVMISGKGTEALIRRGMRTAVIALSLGGAGEVISYIFDVFEVGTCIKCGIICFVILQVFYNLKRYIQIYKDIKNSEVYENLAYIDILTGINNRNAYERDLKILNDEIGSLRFLKCIMIDLNGLKSANDTYGHSIGDKLIRGFSKILSLSIEESNSFYRIGGDEFVIIFKNTMRERITRQLEEVSRRVFEYNIDADVKISYALGSAEYRIDTHKRIEDIVKEADYKMYQNKVESKAQRA